MQIEVVYRTGGARADEWGSDPNLRAEIKMAISEAMARSLRVHDLIQWDTCMTASGDFVVRGFLNAEPGTERLVEHVIDLNPVVPSEPSEPTAA
jgi:hypothetical protein